MKFYRQSDATFYDLINTIYQFIKPFLDKKMSIFEEYGAFNIISVNQFVKVLKFEQLGPGYKTDNDILQSMEIMRAADKFRPCHKQGSA